MPSFDWQKEQLASLLNDNSEAASAKKVELADSMATQLFDMADECDRRGVSGEELKQTAEGFKAFAHNEAQILHERRRTQAVADWLNGKPYAAPST